jgi:hypothetical protein
VVKQKPALVRSDERIEMEAEYVFGLCFEGERLGWDRSSAQGHGADARHISSDGVFQIEAHSGLR